MGRVGSEWEARGGSKFENKLADSFACARGNKTRLVFSLGFGPARERAVL